MTNKELLSKELPDFVKEWDGMTKEELIEAACGEVLDGLRMQERVSLFMEECTIGMSKTTYTLDAIKEQIKAKKESDINEFCFLECDDAEDEEIIKEIKERAKKSYLA